MKVNTRHSYDTVIHSSVHCRNVLGIHLGTSDAISE